ncbi:MULTISPECIES: hypothetical protein [Caproicibacterium]|uniref:Uncharacterized protein n=1 Tax=Caproicibacterium argilliputei TaxID=3030016 RepID=A0AA97DAX0_9FIRM|nr:hypothetical protein [Caproicibacterium argilliputei]WOC33024.1 hypothetical protein PXC00_03865 [Caproicibacterium argilliputei]
MTLSQIIYYCIGRIAVDAGIALAVLNVAYAVHRRYRDKQRQRRQAEAAKARNRKEIIDLMEWRNE